jgi:hypothetical protein
LTVSNASPAQDATILLIAVSPVCGGSENNNIDRSFVTFFIAKCNFKNVKPSATVLTEG